VAIGAGGVAPYKYTFGVCDTGFPTETQGLTLNEATGLIQFKAAIATRSVEWKAADLADKAAATALVGVLDTSPDYAVKMSVKTKTAAALVEAERVARKAGADNMNIAAVVSKKYKAQIIISDSTKDAAGLATPVKVPVTVNVTFDDGTGSSINANLAAVGAGAGSGTVYTLTPANNPLTINVTPGTTYNVVNNLNADGAYIFKAANSAYGIYALFPDGASLTLTAPAGADTLVLSN
jgi:hypothetical protein